jgi:hypothetical protein
MSGEKLTGRFIAGKGCEECRGTGYRGRIGIFELLAITPDLQELILHKSSNATLKAAARKTMTTMHEDALRKASRRHDDFGGDRARLLGRCLGMTAFRYQAIASGGDAVQGVMEAADRRAALQLLGSKGLFPSNLELCAAPPSRKPPSSAAPAQGKWEMRFGSGVKRKESRP